MKDKLSEKENLNLSKNIPKIRRSQSTNSKFKIPKLFKKLYKIKKERPLIHKKKPNIDMNGMLKIEIPSVGEEGIILYNYLSGSINRLLKRGEVVTVKSEISESRFLVASIDSSFQCSVPKTLLVSTEQSFVIEKWYFHHMDKEMARQSLYKSDQFGTFLVRPSKCTDFSSLTISILKEKDSVKHYRILFKPNNLNETEYSVFPKMSFKSVNALIAYYVKDPSDFGVPRLITMPVGNTFFNDVNLAHTPGSTASYESSDSEKIKFYITRYIGGGYFGDVSEAVYPSGLRVAVKSCKDPSGKGKLQFIHEAKILSTLNHSKILPMINFCIKKDREVLLTTEFMINGNLLSYLSSSSSGALLNVFHLIHISCQIAYALSYLETVHLVHRDLAARNILVGEDYRNVKLSDFGLAFYSEDAPPNLSKDMNRFAAENYFRITEIKVAYKWAAPESLFKHSFTTKSDVWSYGVLLYEIFTNGKVPYFDITDAIQFQKKIKEGYRLSKPYRCPDHLYQFIMVKCWQTEPSNRPTFSYIYTKLYNMVSTMKDENGQPIDML